MKKRVISACLLIVYAAILVKIMVFKDIPTLRFGHIRLNFGGTQDGPPNFVPFKSILPYLLGEKGLLIAALNIGGNIILLMPVGFLFPFAYPNMNWKKSLLLGIAAGLSIEAMQATFHLGIFDVDDIMLNSIGVLFGYWTLLLILKIRRSGRPLAVPNG